jgi:hypothetical protein
MLYYLEALHVFSGHVALKRGGSLLDAVENGIIGVRIGSRPIQERGPGVSVFLIKSVRVIAGYDDT